MHYLKLPARVCAINKASAGWRARARERAYQSLTKESRSSWQIAFSLAPPLAFVKSRSCSTTASRRFRVRLDSAHQSSAAAQGHSIKGGARKLVRVARIAGLPRRNHVYLELRRGAKFFELFAAGVNGEAFIFVLSPRGRGAGHYFLRGATTKGVFSLGRIVAAMAGCWFAAGSNKLRCSGASVFSFIFDSKGKNVIEPCCCCGTV